MPYENYFDFLRQQPRMGPLFVPLYQFSPRAAFTLVFPLCEFFFFKKILFSAGKTGQIPMVLPNAKVIGVMYMNESVGRSRDQKRIAEKKRLFIDRVW